MINQYLIGIILLLVIPIFVSCPAKSPELSKQQTQAYNIKDLPLSENLIAHMKSGNEEKYVVYTFYTPLDKEKIHKQYWTGQIVFDDLEVSDQASESTDNLGNRTVNWREDPLRKTYSRDVYNVQGILYKRTTINPDGSSVDSVDLNENGIVDYMEVILPNGENLIIVSDPLGMDFLNELLKGANPYCNHPEIFSTVREEIPGCGGRSGSSSSSASSFGPGIGAAGAGNPYDQLMENMCAGYESSGVASLPSGTYSRKLVGVERRANWRRFQDRIRVGTTVIESYDDASSITYITQVVTTNDGAITFLTEKTMQNPDGSSRTDYRAVTVSTDGSTSTTNGTRTRAGGSSTENASTVVRRRDGSSTTRHSRTTRRPDGSSTERRWETTRRSDGTSTATPVTETECSSDDTCSEPVPVVTGSDTEHPGLEPDHDAAMAEFCEIWNQSQEDRPNDVSELNERANEERCSVEPDESGATEGSSLAETCYADIEGRDELAEMIAAGTCTTASGGTHFDYDSENPGRCTQNRFYILENWLLMNGPAGIVGIEDECRDNPACDPANVLRLE